jgi:hypothetical protein
MEDGLAQLRGLSPPKPRLGQAAPKEAAAETAQEILKRMQTETAAQPAPESAAAEEAAADEDEEEVEGEALQHTWVLWAQREVVDRPSVQAQREQGQDYQDSLQVRPSPPPPTL